MKVRSTMGPKFFLDVLPKQGETEDTFKFGCVNKKSNRSLGASSVFQMF